jgi:hypothetical protein
MRAPFRGSVIAVTAAIVAVGSSLLVKPTVGQEASYRAPRTADGKPNLNGVWQTLNTANYDIQAHAARAAAVLRAGPLGPVPATPVLALGAEGGIPAGLGVVEGDQIPYRPEMVAKKKENADNTLTRDPEVKCYMPGIPRATYMPYPFQIVQGTTNIMFIYEFAGATRTVHLDKVPPAPTDAWMGYAVGHWEGETLVVDVDSFNDQTWFDRAGNFHSDALHVVERYTPGSPYHMNYEVTIQDPKVFTRPWKMSMPIYRHVEKNAQVIEYKCVEFVEELMYGHLRKQPLAQHWEGNYGEPTGTLIFDVTRRAPVIN